MPCLSSENAPHNNSLFQNPEASLENQLKLLQDTLEDCERKHNVQEIDCVLIPTLNFLGFKNPIIISDFIKKALNIRKNICNFLKVGKFLYYLYL